jgi:hypothetical protein
VGSIQRLPGGWAIRPRRDTDGRGHELVTYSSEQGNIEKKGGGCDNRKKPYVTWGLGTVGPQPSWLVSEFESSGRRPARPIWVYGTKPGTPVPAVEPRILSRVEAGKLQ